MLRLHLPNEVIYLIHLLIDLYKPDSWRGSTEYNIFCKGVRLIALFDNTNSKNRAVPFMNIFESKNSITRRLNQLNSGNVIDCDLSSLQRFIIMVNHDPQ